MRVLVTGIAGRIGSLTARRLLDEGHQVSGLDLRAPDLEHPALDIVVGDCCDARAVSAALAGCEAVLHLGALMSWHPDDVDRLFAAKVEGTRRVLETAADAGVGRFLFASSGEVHPENDPAYLPIDEDHPLRPASPYGETLGFTPRHGIDAMLDDAVAAWQRRRGSG